MNTEAINIRYSDLAEKTCCLSCGGAVNHAKPAPGEHCLDLGSGRGGDVIRMAQDAGGEGFAWGLDISEGMLRKAAATAARLGVDNVEFLKSQLEVIPLDSETLDLVVSNCTINHAHDKQAVWNEIHRVLKSGGRFVVSDIYATEEVPEQYRSDPQAVAECWAGAVTRNTYMETLARAGFREIEILEESDPYPKGQIMVSSFTIRGHK
ncbi:methyltransferase domain-containing protein [bacterium]|nr:methyltransferase domain-containing protein [bacterium]